MSFDRANRTVFVMVLMAAAMSAVVALIGFCSYGALTYRLAHDGFDSWTTSGTQAAFVLSVLLTGGLAAGVHVVHRELIATRRLDRRVRRHITEPARLNESAARGGLDGRVVAIDALEPGAFPGGSLRPLLA